MAIEIAPVTSGLTSGQPPETGLPPKLKRQSDKRALWRLCGWGGTAALALTALAVTTQTEIGNQRLQLALAAESPAARPTVVVEAPPRPPEPDAKTLALEAQVRALAADRDRLTVRIAGLERNLEDMTGSIKKQAALASQPPAPAPSVQNVASAPPTIAPLAMPASAETAAPWATTSQPPAAAPTLVTVPMPPTRTAAAPTVEPATEPPRRSELGVDLGGGATLDILNARWAAVKANFGPLLTGLHPLAAHDRRPGSVDMRLLVGPVPNAAAAAQLCARFAAARVTCRPAKFDGEQLAAR